MKKIFLLLAVLSLANFGATAQDTDPALGIQAHQVSKKSAKTRSYDVPYGSLVRSVYDNSAAEIAGIEPFDYIYQINDQRPDQENTIGDLIDRLQPGEEVTVYYSRRGTDFQKTVALSNGDDLSMTHRSREDDPFLGVSAIHEKKPTGVTGVPVSIVHNSTAEAMGLERGDIIVQIDDDRVYNWSDLHAAIDNREVGENIRVKYYREGFNFTQERPIKSRAATHNDHSRPDGPQIIGTPDPELAVPPVALETPQAEETELPIIDEAPLPIAQEISFDQLNIFPNPSDGIFNLQLDLPQRGRTSIQVFDSAGNRVYENNLGEFSGIFSDRIDIANTAKGIYFLLLRQGDKTLSKKLVVR